MSKTYLGLKLVLSPIGTPDTLRATLRTLNLTHMNKKVYQEANAVNLGRINKVGGSSVVVDCAGRWLTVRSSLGRRWPSAAAQAKKHIKIFDVKKADALPELPKRPMQL